MAKLYGNRWKNLGSLKEGGQARIFRVVDTTEQLSGVWALKQLKNRDRVARFRQEVAILRRLDHENIIKLVDADVAEDGRDESSYLVMPIAAHGDLDDRLEIYTGNLDSILQVALQIALALQCAHGSGVIHRDIKPGNILFSDVRHRVWVADFGISFDRSEGRHTQEGEVVGPRFFIAPELEEGRGGDPTPAADIYSLGMVIFYMLTGGKRVVRENVFAEEHKGHFAKGHRYGLLRLLLSRMISPFDRRYRELEWVIRELRQIDQWERNAVGVLLDEHAVAATQQLQGRVAGEIERQANFETVRNDEIRLLHSVAESVIDWLGGVLRVQRNAIGAGAVLEAGVFEGRPGLSQPIKVDTGNNTLLEEQGRVTLAIALPHSGQRTICSVVLAVCSELNFNLGYESSAYFGTPGNPMMAVLPFYSEAKEHQPHLNSEAGYPYGKPRKYGVPDPIPIMSNVPYYRQFVSPGFSDGNTAIARFNARDWPAAQDIILEMVREVLSRMMRQLSQSGG
jgi:hypothetical protein